MPDPASSIAAVVITVAIMMIAADPLARFIEKNPTLVMLSYSGRLHIEDHHFVEILQELTKIANYKLAKTAVSVRASVLSAAAFAFGLFILGGQHRFPFGSGLVLRCVFVGHSVIPNLPGKRFCAHAIVTESIFP